MLRFFLNLALGPSRRHRLEALLCPICFALAFAVVISIDAAVAACVRSFQGAVNTLAERSTHSIFATEGLLTDDAYIHLLKSRPPCPIAPMIDRGVLAASGTTPPTVARLIGVDVF